MIFRALTTLIKRQARVYSLSFYHFSSQPEQVEACKNEQKHAFFWQSQNYVDPLWSFEEFKHKNQMFYKQKSQQCSKKSRREGYFYDGAKWQKSQHSDPSEDWRNLKLQAIEKSGQFKILDDKTIYKGQFLEGKPHGLGINMKFSGQCYKGEWVKGQREGNGKQICKNGVYEGTFKNNLRHGVGIYDSACEATYYGEWKNGKENGVGKWQGGTRYYGYFKNGKFEGIGRIWLKIYQNKKEGQLQYTGVWKNGKLVDAIKYHCQIYQYHWQIDQDQQESGSLSLLTKRHVLKIYPEYREQIQRLKHQQYDLNDEDFNSEKHWNDESIMGLSDEELKLRQGNVQGCPKTDWLSNWL